MTLAVLVAAALTATFPSAAATTGALKVRDHAGTLRAFVRDVLTAHGDDPQAQRSAKVSVARARLGARDPESYLVSVRDGGWCGSGGCTLLVVSRRAGAFRLRLFEGAVEPPISVGPGGKAGTGRLCVFARDMMRSGAWREVVLARSGDRYTPDLGAKHCSSPSRRVVISAGSPAVALY